MKKEKDTIIETLKTAKGNSLDIYSSLYKTCIENKACAPKILQEILQYPDKIGASDGASQVVSEEQEQKFTTMYNELLWKETEKLVKENLTQEEFYQKLWEQIFESDTAPDNEAKGAVCIKILNEIVPFLPYYQAIEMIHMEEEEYAKRIDSLISKIQESIHMVNRRFEQKTEETSQFCRIIRGLDDEDAAVYLASFLNILRRAYIEEGYNKAIKEFEDIPNESEIHGN